MINLRHLSLLILQAIHNNWRLSDVVYVPDEIDENEGMRLDIDHMSYEVMQRFQKINIYCT